MAKKQEKKPQLLLGDPEFTKKMMKLYAWIMPFVFAMMTLAMFLTKAWIPGLIFLCGLVLTIPLLNDFWSKLKIGIAWKFILSILLIALAVYCIKFYV